jgi:hypothetical protein
MRAGNECNRVPVSAPRIYARNRVGIVSLIALALAIPALYVFDLSGDWRNTYVVSSVVALYLNVFVGIVQAFQKLPRLRVLAPKQSEPPFLFTQLAVLLLFVVLGIFITIRFQGTPI